MKDDSSATQANDIAGYEYRGQLYCSEHIISQLPMGEGQEFDGWQLAPGITMAAEQQLSEIRASFYFATDPADISSDDFPKAITTAAMPWDSVCAVCAGELEAVQSLPDFLDFDGVASFNAAELGLESLGMVSMVDVSKIEDEPGQMPGDLPRLAVTVYVSEELQFHGELEADRLANGWKAYSELGRLFTSKDGETWETTEATWADLVPILETRYGAESVEEEGGVLRFNLRLTVSESLPLDQLGAAIWEESKLVQFSNEADPGTFGSPYLFGSVLSEARKAGETDAS